MPLTGEVPRWLTLTTNSNRELHSSFAVYSSNLSFSFVFFILYLFCSYILRTYISINSIPPHTVQAAKRTHVFVHISKWASWHRKRHHQRKLQVMTSWALVGAGCSNQLQVAKGQVLVSFCAAHHFPTIMKQLRVLLRKSPTKDLCAATFITTTDEGSSKLPKRLVFQRKPLVGDFRKRTLSDATQPDKLLQQYHETIVS